MIDAINISRIPKCSIIPKKFFQKICLPVTGHEWIALASELEKSGYFPSKLYTIRDVYLGIGFMDGEFQHVFTFKNYGVSTKFGDVVRFSTGNISESAMIILDNT